VKAKFLIILSIVFFFTSCKTEREEKFKKPICGEWIFVRAEKNLKSINPDKIFPPTLIHGYYRNGYTFFPDNSCENKLGYFKNINSKWIFLGTSTKYKIEEDSLKILNLIDSTWESTKIQNIALDTLTLVTKDSTLIKYGKAHYKSDNKQSFDKIIISSSACFGHCPINDVLIDDNGSIIFWGEHNSTVSGLFSSKVNKQVYSKIEQNFKKLDIDTLKEEPSEDCYDCPTTSVTFIKDNKIYRTIEDRMRQTPKEFYWAYMPLKFLYQTINLKPLVEYKYEQLAISSIAFETTNQICYLKKSEGFFLVSELFNSKEVSLKFKRKYTIKYWGRDTKTKKIYTDGRYYELNEKGKNVTLDLGYNFITRNNLLKKFRPINDGN